MNSSDSYSCPIAIVGGGAAGLFTAAQLAKLGYGEHCSLFEKTQKPAAKILISGGGRCNVTHACFDAKTLVGNYPRGNRELLGPFQRFGPRECVAWFESQNVELKTEEDGRMFPQSDQSHTIANCLIETARNGGVHFHLGHGIDLIEKTTDGFFLYQGQQQYFAKYVLIATGSHPSGHRLAANLGHTITERVPSLFSFHIDDFFLQDQAGISLQVCARLKETIQEQSGTMLITHWGFSGPAILRLSAWAARYLHSVNYHTDLWIDWLPALSESELIQKLKHLKSVDPQTTLFSSRLFHLPKNLFKALTEHLEINCHQPLGHLADSKVRYLVQMLKSWHFKIKGQSTHKQEFVTCGGINLSEVDFKRFESKLHTGLFFAGEVLDIDAITGGFNFQNAWTGAWHVASAIASNYSKGHI